MSVTIAVEVLNSDSSVSMTEGGFQTRYALEQFHFHWGPDNSVGSEHTVNGLAYPLEVRAPNLLNDIIKVCQFFLANMNEKMH